MTMARIADIAEQLRGVTFGKGDAVPTPRDGYVPVLTASNIRDGRIVTDELTYVPVAKVGDKQMVRENDVVVCASSGSLSVVGKAARSHGDFVGGFGAFLKVLRPGPEVDPSYFAHFFQTSEYRREVSRLAAGANINNLKNEHLSELSMPLPPLAEQRRIATILDKTDVLRNHRRRAIASLQDLARAVFFDMFGDPRNNTRGWPTNDFATTMRDATAGSPKVPRSAFQASGRYPVVDQGQQYIAGYVDDAALLCPVPTPVIAFGDHTRSVKLVNFPFVLGADGVKVLAPRDPVTPKYLAWLLRLAPVQSLGYSRHMRELKRMTFPTPPLALQEEFGQRISAIEFRIQQHENQLPLMDELVESLRHRAYWSRV